MGTVDLRYCKILINYYNFPVVMVSTGLVLALYDLAVEPQMATCVAALALVANLLICCHSHVDV